MQKVPLLRSKQEEIVESYINNSFGTAFLYSPINYKYVDEGHTRDGEPCDLFWYCEDLVVIFSMTSSKKDSLAKQIKHNISQIEEYLIRWKTGLPEFSLCGINRFEESCCIKYCEVKNFILVSIVGKKCGISKIKTDAKSREIWLNAPDRILEILAKFNGSLVDFLDLSLAPKNYGKVDTYEGLCLFCDKYIASGLSVFDSERLKILESFEKDIASISSYLESAKSLKVGAEMKFLYDLNLSQRTNLLCAIFKAIHDAEPPNFPNHTRIVTELYYTFIITFLNFSSENHNEMMAESLDLGKNLEDDGCSPIYLNYGNLLGGADFRSPLMVALSESKQKLQAKFLFDRYLAWNVLPSFGVRGIYSYEYYYRV